jgi:hypothetical protein
MPPGLSDPYPMVNSTWNHIRSQPSDWKPTIVTHSRWSATPDLILSAGWRSNGGHTSSLTWLRRTTAPRPLTVEAMARGGQTGELRPKTLNQMVLRAADDETNFQGVELTEDEDVSGMATAHWFFHEGAQRRRGIPNRSNSITAREGHRQARVIQATPHDHFRPHCRLPDGAPPPTAVKLPSLTNGYVVLDLDATGGSRGEGPVAL